MFLDENIFLAGTSSVMDSPILATVERAIQRQEGKKNFCFQINSLPGHVIQKGLLWQQRDKLFARWKERYFILTNDYLHCFRKSNDNSLDKISHMGSFIFKIKLVDVERVSWINKKTYSAIALDFGRDNRILLRSQQKLKDWFDSLEECTLASKERRRVLKSQRESYQGENEQNINSINSNVEEWLEARKKIAQLHRDYISDSFPDIPNLEFAKNSLKGRLGNDQWFQNPLNKANQKLSLLTDIDINALNPAPSPFEVEATPTPCSLNSDIFFLPGFRARQRSSIAEVEFQNRKTTHYDHLAPRIGNASDLKSKNQLGSFRIPNMLQKRVTANRYSLVNNINSLKVIYSTYANNCIST